MIVNRLIIDFCLWLRCIIIGGLVPKNNTVLKWFGSIVYPKKKINKKQYANWSEAEYKMHFRNAASNMGLMREAEEWWYEQPLEWRRKREKQMKERKERYG